MILLKSVYPNDYKLLKRKGVFPYDWFNSQDKMQYSRLPDKSEFKSKLSDEELSDDDYNYAKYIWNHFKMNTFKDYHNLYLQTDVLLLADVFEKFRKTSLEYFKIDPTHFSSLPSFGWQCMLKQTGVKLDYVYDMNMHNLFEEGIRGGISSIMKRFAVANNSYLKNYNPDQPDSFIVYIDKNSLYPEAMKDYLPYSDFKWVEDVDNIDIINVPSDAERGYILEVDLEYPPNLHNYHNQYPLAPEHYKPADTELSKYNDGHTNQKIKKLIPTLKNKNKYVLHYRNLQYYIMMGMKLTKIHRAISFNQSAWMLPYIEFCGDQRKIATSENEKS